MTITHSNNNFIISVNSKTFSMLKAVSELISENKEVNPFSIAKKSTVTWRTAKRFCKNNLNIKELKC